MASVIRHQNRAARRLAPCAAACLLWASATQAQTPAAPATAASATPADSAQTVVITGRSVVAPDVAGFGREPLERSPFAASTLGAKLLDDAGITSLAGASRVDASFGDAYNSPGYWSNFTARGFVLDQRHNFRRDGLPINAETALPLANKERVELLKGTSGIQAGTSAPGGLANLVVKRPSATLRNATLGFEQDGTLQAAIDWSERFGANASTGLRVNAATARLDPRFDAAKGTRHLLAAAADWAVDGDRLLEAEIEWSRQSQPSVPAFSLLGNTLPDAKDIDSRTNLNTQPWSQPVVLAGTTASLRWQQNIGDGWRFQAHGAVQRLRSDDRIAFPFGCYDAGADVYYADRYCPDGRFDLYDYRSDGERRDTSSIDLQLRGNVQTGSLKHALTAGVLFSRQRDRFNLQAFNYAGQGAIDGRLLTPAASDATTDNTNRDERSTEWYVRDVVTINRDWAAWLGLRTTALRRSTVRTDGSEATSPPTQHFTTPWLALTRRLGDETTAYLSWGQGIEAETVPNRSRYTNRGAALPALKSRQFELGIKHAGKALDASVAAFDIRRPQASDFGACDVDDSCTRAIDGAARHRGVEGSVALRDGPWQWQASAMALHARREGAADPASNGLKPVNVPERGLRLGASRRIEQLRGLTVAAGLTHEGPRMVLPDNGIAIPGWTRLDLSARWETTLAERPAVWRVGIDNLTDRRAWRESPYQFGHVYLFPLDARTLRASLQVTL